MTLVWNLGAIIDILGALLVIAIGLFVVRVRPRRRTNLALVAFAVPFGVMFTFRNPRGVWAGPVGPVVFEVVPALTGILAAAGLVWLATVVPRRLRRKERGLLAAAAGVGVGLAAAAAAQRGVA